MLNKIVVSFIALLTFSSSGEARETLFEHNYKDFSKLQKQAAVKTWSTCAAAFQLLEETQQDPQLRSVFTTRKNGASMTVSMISS